MLQYKGQGFPCVGAGQAEGAAGSFRNLLVFASAPPWGGGGLASRVP